jgi:hypothetical protein
MLRSPALIKRDLGQLHHGMSLAVNAHHGKQSILDNIDDICKYMRPGKSLFGAARSISDQNRWFLVNSSGSLLREDNATLSTLLSFEDYDLCRLPHSGRCFTARVSLKVVFMASCG